MAYEREAQTDIAELQRLAASLTETDPPSGYERDAQTDLVELSRLARDVSETDPAQGGYERVGQTNVAVLRRKLLGGNVVVATGYSLSGPSSGNVGVASTNFTVTLTPSGGTVVGAATITPSDGGGGGTFTPSAVGLSKANPTATFTYTAGSAGTKTISTTNDKSLTNPTSLSYVAAASGGGTAFLLDNLISYWKLDEASGTRNDSQGTNHLSVNNAPVGVAGKINNGCQFVAASSQGIFCGSNSTLQVTSDFTFSMWVRMDSLANGSVLAKTDLGANQDYELNYNTGIGLYFVVHDNVGGANGAVGTGPATVGVWYHIVAWFDSSDRKARFRVNDTTTNVSTDPALGATLNASAVAFTIGQSAHATPVFLNGTVDEVGFWKRKLTASEITALYNGGAGLPLSSFTRSSLADGDPVSTWTDSSINGNNATMTGTNRPTFKSAIVNGKPVVRFTAAGLSRLNLASSIVADPPWTVLTVGKASGSGGLALGSTTSNGPFAPLVDSNGFFYFSGAGNRYRTYAAVGGGSIFNVAAMQFGVASDGSSDHLYANGTDSILSIAAVTNTGGFNTIGFLAPSQYSDVDLAEIIIYNSVLSSTDRANVEKYLGTKYGITVAGGTAVQPDTVTGLVGWWKADSLDAEPDNPLLAGLKGWWKADAIGGSDGDLLSAWNDSSSNGFNLTNTGGTARPTYKTNILNGKPVVRFDGVANYLRNIVNPVVTQPNTLFVVGKQPTVAQNARILQSGVLGASPELFVVLATSGNYALYAGLQINDAANHSGAFHVYTGVFNGGSSAGYIDGTSVTTGNVGTGSLQGVALMFDTGTSEFDPGDIAEVLVYDSALGSTDRAAVEAYLKAKYGTP